MKTTNDPQKETQVTWRVRRYLAEAGYRVRAEVPFLSKRIDLVGVLPRTGHVVAVEAKVDHWRQGLQQVLPYRLCAHEAFLAVSARHVPSVDLELLAKYGIGLMAVDGIAKVEMRAQTSKVLYPAFLAAVRSQVMTRG